MPKDRCPMCSKVNEADVEICVHCGARLTPLMIDPTSEDYRADVPQETPSEAEADEEPSKRGTDWLGRLRATAVSSEEPPGPPAPAKKTGELPDWLDRLRPPKRIGAREEGEEIIEPEDKPRGTDWLQRLRKVPSPPDAAAEEPALIDDDAASADEGELARAEIPEWLQVTRVDEGEVADTEEEDVSIEENAYVEEDDAYIEKEDVYIEEAEAYVEDADAYIEEEEARVDEAETHVEEAEAHVEVADAYVEEEDAYVEEEEAEESIELGERLAMHAPEPSKLDEIIEEREEDLPAETIEEPEEVEVGSEDSEEAPGVEELQVSQTPALILDDEALEGELQDVDLESIRVPEWVGDDQIPDASAIDGDAEEGPQIAKAVLPGWLEAMRPIETFRTQEEDEGEEPQSVETIGPLAGLSGVLSAEPVVAMPRTPGVAAARISITQQENEQVRILRGLVEAEQKDIAPSRPLLRAAPILHWIAGSLLVAAVVLPQLISESIFPAPRWVPQDLETLRSLVEELPQDRPALVVADYDPGYSAELEAVGSSLLDHLLQRGMSVVTLSTRASGPALAQRLIDSVTAWHSVEAGEDYLHLGYLSGGPTAVQLFASNPRYGSLRGFMLPEEREWSTPWEAPILSGVQRLSDFGVVVVITAGTETARTWAEQAAPQTGETPFIMVLSAGAEPLVRPYYANPDRQVDAIFTGLPSGKANELLNGRSGDASLLWDAFGMGGWAATGVIVIGGLIGLVASVLRGRAKDVGDA